MFIPGQTHDKNIRVILFLLSLCVTYYSVEDVNANTLYGLPPHTPIEQGYYLNPDISGEHSFRIGSFNLKNFFTGNVKILKPNLK